MKGIRLIVFAYCLLGALAGSATTAIFGTRLSKESAQLDELAAALSAAQATHQTAKDELLALREKQRVERDNYNAQQAIEASANTQVAIEKESQLLQVVDDLERQHSTGRQELQQRQTKLVPLIALTLFHFLLIPLTFRRRGQG